MHVEFGRCILGGLHTSFLKLERQFLFILIVFPLSPATEKLKINFSTFWKVKKF